MTKIASGVVLGGGVGAGTESGAEGVPVDNDQNISQLGRENPCLLEEVIDPCGYSVAGVHRLFLARRSQIDEYYFHTYNNRNKIKSIKAVGGGISWIEWKVERDAHKFSESQVNTAFGPAFAQRIDMSYAPMDWEKRRALRPLTGAVGHVALIQDTNLRWWLCGEAKGLKTTERLSETGNDKGRNGYDISITSIEPQPVREVLDSWVEDFVLNPPIRAAGGGQISTLTGLIVSNFQGIRIDEL